MRQRHPEWLPALLVLVLHVGAFALAAAGIGQVVFADDSREYLAQALNLKLHGLWACNTWNTPIDLTALTRRPPLYGLLIRLATAVAPSPLVVVAVQGGLSLLNVWGIHRLLRRHDVPAGAGWLLVAALLLGPAQLIYANVVMSEILFQTTLVWALAAFAAFLRDRRPGWLGAYNVLIALGMLVKPVLAFFWLPSALLQLWLVLRHRLRPALLSLALIPLVTYLAIVQVNARQTGYPHYSSIAATNLLHWNTRFLLTAALPAGEAERRVMAIETAARQQPSLGGYIRYVNRECQALLVAHAPTYVRLQAQGMATYFLDVGRFDLVRFLGWASPATPGLQQVWAREGFAGVARALQRQSWCLLLYLGVIGLANLVLGASLVPFARDRRVALELRLLALLLIGYLCVLTGPLGASRFRVPVLPLLWFALPFGLDSFRARLARHQPHDPAERPGGATLLSDPRPGP